MRIVPAAGFVGSATGTNPSPLAIATLGAVGRMAIGLSLRSASLTQRCNMAAFSPRAKATAAIDTPGCWHAPAPKQAWEWCSHRWGVVTKAAGWPDVTLHILRHTCASRLVQRGVPIYTVTKWLGHSSVKVTERYAKLAPGNLSQALSALEGKPTLAKGLLTRGHAVDENVSTGHRTLKAVK
jgi:hypothetical protein